MNSSCPSCNMPISSVDVSKKNYWRVEDKPLPYRCPHCGTEIIRAQSEWSEFWPYLILISLAIFSSFIDSYIDHYMLPLSAQAKAVASGLRSAFDWITFYGIWFWFWYSLFYAPRKPYWKIAQPKTDKNNEGI